MVNIEQYLNMLASANKAMLCMLRCLGFRNVYPGQRIESEGLLYLCAAHRGDDGKWIAVPLMTTYPCEMDREEMELLKARWLDTVSVRDYGKKS